MSEPTVVETARAEWKQTSGVFSEQKKDEIDDLSFLLPENQWDDWAKDARKALPEEGLNARPMISVDKLGQPIDIQVNKLRNAHLGITVNPESEDADKDTAEVIQGIYRKWEQNSNADLARFWAYDRAIKAGTGVYFVGYDYDRTTGNAFDQSVVWKRILNQADVYFDPSAQEMDWSDGEYVFWVKWLSRDAFKQKYGKSALAGRLAGGTSNVWGDIVQAAPEWAEKNVKTDSDKAIMLAEYWKKVYTDVLAVQLDDWSVVKSVGGKEPVIPKGRKALRERIVKDQSLMYYVLTGLQEKPLAEEKWNGRYLPFVPVIGRELQTFDEKRRWRGMVRNAKGVQKSFNYAYTDLQETVGLQSKTTHLLDPRQVANFRGWWNIRNIRPLPFLPYDASVVGPGGTPLPPPQLTQVDSTKMQSCLMLLQEAGQALDDVTATYAPSRGEMDSHRSGKAVLALQSQSDESSGGFESNFVEISLPCEARIVLDYMPTLLERPGRMLDMVTPDEQSERVMLNQPYVSEGGIPRPVSRETEGAKFFDLSKGIYSVETEAGKSYSSRLKQGQEQYPILMQALPPEAAMILAPDVIRFSPAPGAQASADKMQKFVDHQFPFLAEKEGGEPTPEQMQAQLAAQQKQIEEMTQIGQQMQRELETDAEKQRGQLEKAKIDAAVKGAQTQDDNQTQVAIAKLKAETDLEIATQGNQTKFAIEELKLGVQDTHQKIELILGLLSEQEKRAEERRLDDQQGAHELGLKALDHQAAKEQREHDREMTAAGMLHEDVQGEAGREHEADQAELARQAVPQGDGSGE